MRRIVDLKIIASGQELLNLQMTQWSNAEDMSDEQFIKLCERIKQDGDSCPTCHAKGYHTAKQKPEYTNFPNNCSECVFEVCSECAMFDDGDIYCFDIAKCQKRLELIGKN